MKNLRSKKSDKPMIFWVCMGLGCALLLSLIAVAVMTSFVSSQRLSVDDAMFAMPVIQFLSAFSGCLIAGSMSGGNKMAVSGVVSVVYYVLLVGISALIMDGISGEFWVGAAASVIAFLLSVLILTRVKISGRGGKRRRSSR